MIMNDWDECVFPFVVSSVLIVMGQVEQGRIIRRRRQQEVEAMLARSRQRGRLRSAEDQPPPGSEETVGASVSLDENEGGHDPLEGGPSGGGPDQFDEARGCVLVCAEPGVTSVLSFMPTPTMSHKRVRGWLTVTRRHRVLAEIDAILGQDYRQDDDDDDDDDDDGGGGDDDDDDDDDGSSDMIL
jgi:hypothetical protein